MDSLEHATRVNRLDETTWATELREDWGLWGPSGGYITSLALRVAGEATTFTRPVSLSCQFLRVGKFMPVTLRVEKLRSGRRSELLRVDMMQDGKVLLTTTIWVMQNGADGMVHDYAKIDPLPSPDKLPSREDLFPDQSIPPFMQRFDERPIKAMPGDNTVPREPELSGLYRLRPKGASDNIFADAGRAIILLDTYGWLATYPAHPTRDASPWMAPNFDYYYRFHRETMGHDWLYMSIRANLAHDSLISTEGEIHDLQGNLLISGASQLFCRPRPNM